MLNNQIYNTKTLLNMLDYSINLLIENKVCSSCLIYNCQDDRCLEVDFCKLFLFEGILKNIRNNKN